ncbi:MAG: HipA family kinase, partial [Bradyrhizobium sp.]
LTLSRSPMPVNARRLIRKMRGGAQAHLIEASDGHCYVVKFLNNPQHRRILINEWIASVFLKYLGISTPEVAMVCVSEAFLQDNPEAYIQLKTHRCAPRPGWHFGSRFPGDPERNVIYDFLPDSLLGKVDNVGEFAGMFAFDKWVGNADSRQAVFFRARLKEWLPSTGAHPLRLGFVAQMVDNGFAFEGAHWRLTDFPLHGLYFRPSVYSTVRSQDDFQPWLDRIVHFPEEVMDHVIKQIPTPWLEGEEKTLAMLLERLMVRCKRVPDLLTACRDGGLNPFPNWK